MLGNLSQTNNNNGSKVRAIEIESITKKVEHLKELINVLQERIDDLSDNVVTENVVADNASLNKIEANIVTSDNVKSDAADIKNIVSGFVEAITVVADSVTASTVDANLKGQLLSVQNQFTALVGKIDTLNSNQIKAVKAVIDEIDTQSLTMSLLETNELGANNISSEFGRIKELKADNFEVTDKANIPELDTAVAHLGSVDADFIGTDRIEARETVTESIETGKLVSPSFEGYTILNLDPQLATQDDWYQLKILKGFDQFELAVRDSLDIKLIQSYVKGSSTKAATIAVIHQKDLNEVTMISEDDDYVYINISPDNTNELLYRYSTKDEDYSLKDFITFDYDGTIEYEWYYSPAKTSEIIVLGNSTEDYQFTILGKMVTAISPDFYNVKFDDITVSHNIFVKDYFDETLDYWVYKSGVENQYLSTINESFDEETQKWITRIEWKHPVDNTEVGALELTDDSTEDILDSDGNKLGTRTIYGTKTRLVTANTVANWNGKVKSDGSIVEKTVGLADWFNDPEYVTITHDYGDFAAFIPSNNITTSLWRNKDRKELVEMKLEAGIEHSVNRGVYPDGRKFWAFSYKNTFLYTDEFTGDVYTDVPGTVTVETGGTSEYNPITKLGIVDEGSVEYKAGFVHTEELGIKNPIKWSNDTETEQKDYQVWLNGEEPTEDDLDWVRR
jgi:hypothetical protein